MRLDTVAVTGGNGKIGEAILRRLSKHGYRTVNVARGKQREDVSDEYRTTDLVDAGDVMPRSHRATRTASFTWERYLVRRAIRDTRRSKATR